MMTHNWKCDGHGKTENTEMLMKGFSTSLKVATGGS